MSGYDYDPDRARDLADGADHHSVTAAWLTGSGGHPSNSYLYDEPAIAHLERGEQPHLVLYNERKGVGIDEKGSTMSPDPAGITLVLVTDRRTLAIVGQETGDESISIPHEGVVAAEYETGIMKHRLTVETDARTYHLWVNSGYDDADLKRAVELIGQFRSERTGGPSAGGYQQEDARVASSDGGATAGSSGGGSAGTGSAGTGGGRDEDPLEKLERLKDLRDQGVITDEEFQRKKQDLLDQI